VRFSIGPSNLDTTVPVLLLKLSNNVMQHGTLGIIRSLGRLGVPVYPMVEDRLAPPAMSRYAAKSFLTRELSEQGHVRLGKLNEAGQRLGRPTILVPTDDSGAVFIAEHAGSLARWFLFPRIERDLPRRLANKRDLYQLCTNLGIPCPETNLPNCLDDVREFIESARFPVVIKAPEPFRLPQGVLSVRIVESAKRLLALYEDAAAAGINDLFLQEFIPDHCAEDWIFHGYANPETGYQVSFTGRKLRSYPPFAGSTTLGVAERNDELIQQTERFLKAVRYAGIMDLDYRLDKRDGRYKLLDFNPRIGANFRMFADRDGLDVIRAQHLDLTGRTVRLTRGVQDRTFVVEPYDVLASLGYLRRNQLTLNEWWGSLGGRKETAWFSADDPVPFLAMCVRLLLRGFARLIGKARARLRLNRSTADTGPTGEERRPRRTLGAYK
jgi:predicted ATP-grasp superfamily ATP-dependent carboligase